MYTIDKNTAEALLLERPRYPFKQMDIGDSFFLDDFRLAESARISAINCVKRHELPWRFSLRKIDKGWRIFRVH